MASLTKQAADLFIRPQRTDYPLDNLGPATFTLAGRKFQREDMQLVNARGLKLECSHFVPARQQRTLNKMPCVIYLHGNVGCRTDALDFLDVVLLYNCTLFCVDLAGSGKSEGEYISLGFHEMRDVECIVSHLKSKGKVSSICLIGRSMGAATAILSTTIIPDIKTLILDSPFSDLAKLAEEVVCVETKAPKMMLSPVVSLGLKMLRKKILKRAHFDIAEVRPIAAIESCTVPALFLHGSEDTFIAPSHSKDLYAKHPGLKKMVVVRGDHNSWRPALAFNEVSEWLYRNFLNEQEREVLGSVGMPMQIALKVPNTHYFLCRVAPYSDPISRLKQHVVLYVTAEGFETRYAWSELRIKEYPYSAVVNYTAHATKFVIEYKTGSGLIDFQTLFTVEATDIEAVINEFVQQAVLKKMEGMELPRTIDDIVRKVVVELNKKQEKIDKKEIAETIESLIPMDRASISRQELHNMIIEAINRALEKP